jgi:hypothetical protein
MLLLLLLKLFTVLQAVVIWCVLCTPDGCKLLYSAAA